MNGRNRAMEMTFVDLFSGCGGMSTGFLRNGNFRPIGAVDLEVAKPSHKIGATMCNDTYEANIGLRPLSGDLAKIGPNEVSAHFSFEPDNVDLLISCAPCTGYSQKRSSNHTKDDPRNSLVQRTADFAERWMPRYIVIENVKELIKGKHSHHYRFLHYRLSELGYSVSGEVHDLQDFGLPQSRVRALIVAHLGDPLSVVDTFARSRRTVRDTIAHLPPLEAGKVDPNDDQHICPAMNKVSLERMRAIPKDGGSWIDIPKNLEYLLIPSMDRNNAGSFPDIYGRMAWDKVAPTITRECSHQGNGRYSHPMQDRLLSVREMSLLQGFPPDYKFLGSLSFRYRQVGDAVPPLISQMIADAIVNHEKGRKNNRVVDLGQLRLAV
jgi:DNA (cytosine-5)-methyltransferase 1